MEKLLLVSEIARSPGRSIDGLRKSERKGRIPEAERNLTNQCCTPRRIFRRLTAAGVKTVNSSRVKKTPNCTGCGLLTSLVNSYV